MKIPADQEELGHRHNRTQKVAANLRPNMVPDS
jgi:hypothetical protein